jgi:hypothetical protein
VLHPHRNGFVLEAQFGCGFCLIAASSNPAIPGGRMSGVDPCVLISPLSVEVDIPTGLNPGDLFFIQMPDGTMSQFTVPEGKSGGDKMTTERLVLL